MGSGYELLGAVVPKRLIVSKAPFKLHRLMRYECRRERHSWAAIGVPLESSVVGV